MSWSGFKKNVGRATTQVMMKTGHVEKTSDREYEVEERRYRTLESASLRLQKEAKGYLDSLRAMTASQMRIAETIDAFYGESGAKDGVSRSYKQAVEDLDAETVKALDGPYRCVTQDPELKKMERKMARLRVSVDIERKGLLEEIEEELNWKVGNQRHYTQDVEEGLEGEELIEFVYRTTVLEPINRFCAYFPDINECIKKRNHKMLDYDSMRSKVKKLTEKPDKDPSKLPRTEKETEMVNQLSPRSSMNFEPSPRSSMNYGPSSSPDGSEVFLLHSPPKVLDGIKHNRLAKLQAEEDAALQSVGLKPMKRTSSIMKRVSRASTLISNASSAMGNAFAAGSIIERPSPPSLSPSVRTVKEELSSPVSPLSPPSPSPSVRTVRVRPHRPKSPTASIISVRTRRSSWETVPESLYDGKLSEKSYDSDDSDITLKDVLDAGPPSTSLKPAPDTSPCPKPKNASPTAISPKVGSLKRFSLKLSPKPSSPTSPTSPRFSSPDFASPKASSPRFSTASAPTFSARGCIGMIPPISPSSQAGTVLQDRKPTPKGASPKSGSTSLSPLRQNSVSKDVSPNSGSTGPSPLRHTMLGSPLKRFSTTSDQSSDNDSARASPLKRFASTLSKRSSEDASRTSSESPSKSGERPSKIGGEDRSIISEESPIRDAIIKEDPLTGEKFIAHTSLFHPSELEEIMAPFKREFWQKYADKVEQAKAAYEQLNQQLTDELPQLIDLRVPYLDPSFEALVKIQLRFCAEAYSRMAQVQQYLAAETRDQYASGDLDARVEDVLGQIRELSIAGTV